MTEGEREMLERMKGAVMTLPEITRRAFLLHCVDDLGYGEIAQRLGIDVGTVEAHVAAARAHIDRVLDGERVGHMRFAPTR